jgi:CubicO group peptidase (beta-lactamase class C family)
LLEPPERGVQFTMEASIPANSETEYCQFVRTGDESLIVNHDEVRFSAGSHHVLLFMTAYDERPLGVSGRGFGHFGAGGSLGFADPEVRLAFGYATNVLGAGWQTKRNRELTEAVYASL